MGVNSGPLFCSPWPRQAFPLWRSRDPARAHLSAFFSNTYGGPFHDDLFRRLCSELGGPSCSRRVEFVHPVLGRWHERYCRPGQALESALRIRARERLRGRVFIIIGSFHVGSWLGIIVFFKFVYCRAWLACPALAREPLPFFAGPRTRGVAIRCGPANRDTVSLDFFDAKTFDAVALGINAVVYSGDASTRFRQIPFSFHFASGDG